MIRQSPKLSFLLAAVGLILGFQSVAVAQTTPQNPSYEGKWIETNVESSPFLELRNERDTDAPEGPDEPETPDTPTVEGSDAAGEESSPEDSTSSEERSASDTSASTTGDTSESAGSVEAESREGEADTSGSDDAETEPSDGDGSEGGTEPSPDESVGDLLRNLDPAAPSAILEDVELRAGPVDLHEIPLTETALEAQPVDPAPGDPGGPWWWEYRFWILGGLVVLLVTGMFFWSRRRRVTVIERNYPSAEDFFQDELKRNREPVEPGEEPAGDRFVDFDEGPVATAPSESLYETLNEHGFDAEHQALVEKYYSEGLTRREVAQESSLGDGEVGLVLDLADRIREEETHAERA